MVPIIVCESVSMTISLKRSGQPSEGVKHSSLSVLKDSSPRSFQQTDIVDWCVCPCKRSLNVVADVNKL